MSDNSLVRFFARSLIRSLLSVEVGYLPLLISVLKQKNLLFTISNRCLSLY